MAELQGLSPTFLAKIFAKLEKAGIVAASEGVRGGYRLARAPSDISFLAIVDAIEGEKPLFDCQDVRTRCPLFGAKPPAWATDGVCAVHAVMLQAEQAMRDCLAQTSLCDVATRFRRKAPAEFGDQLRDWIGQKADGRVAGLGRARTRRRNNREPLRYPSAVCRTAGQPPVITRRMGELRPAPAGVRIMNSRISHRRLWVCRHLGGHLGRARRGPGGGRGPGRDHRGLADTPPPHQAASVRGGAGGNGAGSGTIVRRHRRSLPRRHLGGHSRRPA